MNSSSLSNTTPHLDGVRQRQLTSHQPPSYAPSGSASHGPLNPVNYVSIIRGERIKGSFTVDCDFQTPEYLRPRPQDWDRTRKNLVLDSCRGIEVDITIVGSLHGQERVLLAASTGNSRVSLTIKVVRGSVTSAVYFVLSFLQMSSTVPFHLEARSRDAVIVYLPRDFHGLLVARSSRGRLDVSAVSERLTLFNESGLEFQYFVGDIPKWAESQESWKGDECCISGESVVVKYVDG
jgi:hypothetical protein